MALVERETQLDGCTGWLARGPRAAGAVLLLDGPVGSGKSALLREYERLARDAGVLTLSATCSCWDRELPFAALGQLFSGSSGETRALVDELLADPDGDTVVRTVNRLCGKLLELASGRPVLLTLDDAHHCDPGSHLLVTRLAHRIGAAPLLLAVTHRSDHAFRRRPVVADLASLPRARRLRVPLLSAEGVARITGDRGLFAATGGNPLLVHALAKSAHEFGRTALACLAAPATLRLARALAVRGPGANAATLAELAGIEPATAEAVLADLAEAGLVRRGDFGHPVVRAGLLETMSGPERAALHRDVARLQHRDGDPAASVAGHLAAAGYAEDGWAAETLTAAAGRALTAGRCEEAVGLLGLVHRASRTATGEALARARLAKAESRLDPALAARHLDALAASARAGHLPGHETGQLIRQLLWLGHTATARELLNALPGADIERVIELELWQQWCYPATTPRRTPPMPRQPSGVRLPPLVRLAAPSTLRQTDSAVTAAVGLLGELSSGAEHAAGVEAALLAFQPLLLQDDLATATTWCDRLATHPARSRIPLWRAVLEAVRADIACRAGRFAEAVTHGENAFRHLAPAGWGVAAGLPLSCLILANTRMGAYREADDYLAVTLPEASPESRYTLPFLHARGQHLLATGLPRAALADFLHCGELMIAWGLDLPGILPWRSCAAEAALRLGDREKARKLVTDQLTRPGPAAPKSRGIALRLLAITGEPADRVRLLAESLDELETGADHYELARTLAELGRAHQLRGERRKARMITRRAWQLAGACHARPLCDQLLPDVVTLGGTRPAHPPEALAVLTRSERRVAALAATGYTNREIAGKLFVTTSTVEQHLTKVFRKLNVRQRDELPVSLCQDTSRIA